jgi:hypothetical protein
LATEKAAIVAMLDETYPKSKKENGDDNAQTKGREHPNKPRRKSSKSLKKKSTNFVAS